MGPACRALAQAWYPPGADRSWLVRLTARPGHPFARPEPQEALADPVEGLPSDLRRRNGWTMAERPGHPGPGLGEVRSYVTEHPGDPSAVLVPDDAQAQQKTHRPRKKRTKSVGWPTSTAG